MKILEVILIASQLAFVVCLPLDIRFAQPNLLRLRQVPTESVSLGLSEHEDQGQSVPLAYFVTDGSKNQFVNSSPKLVISESPSVEFVQRTREGQGNYVRAVQSELRSQHVAGSDGSSGQRGGIVFEGLFHPRSDRVANIDRENEVIDQQHGFVIIPSVQTGQDSLGLNEKQEQRLPNPQIFIFRSSDVQNEPRQNRKEGHHPQEIPSSQKIPNIGPIAGNHSHLGTESPGQTIDSSVQSQPHGHGYPISETLPLKVEEKAPQTEQRVRGSAEVPRSDATFVTRLTAPSNDPESSNTLMITKKPCEICCIGDEVQPCKSCCAFTPLLNPKTLKTVVG